MFGLVMKANINSLLYNSNNSFGFLKDKLCGCFYSLSSNGPERFIIFLLLKQSAF